MIEEIVAAIAPQRGQRVVEIGPGLSAITRPLTAVLGALCVIELDRDLAQGLALNPQLKVIQGDVLRVDFSALWHAWPHGWAQAEMPAEMPATMPATMPASAPAALAAPPRLRVVGNLPYNISTPILFHLLEHVQHIEDQHFMLQQEVVERMVAPVGNTHYSRLSVMLQWRYAMEWVLKVDEQAFDPPPRVKSAVVRMVPLAQPPILELHRFSSLVQVAFSQRRKLLRHALEPWLMAQGWTGAFDFKRRAQEVSVEEYVALSQSLPVK